MQKQMKDLITKLKGNDQDNEFYPTTKEIIETVSKDISKNYSDSVSVLDIGAGDGNFFKVLEEMVPKDKYDRESIWFNKYAIEKSSILIERFPSDVFIIGTDFHCQTLIDKKMDIIFCNPPYLEYEIWTEKIISEANSNTIYMVIPKRWKENDIIKSTIKQRSMEYSILGSFSFEDSEYRKARAKVEIVKFYKDKYAISDPFDIWFKKTFKINVDEEKAYKSDLRSQKKKELNELIKGQNLIEHLNELYHDDLSNLFENYSALEKLDSVIFKELGIDVDNLKTGLQSKIKGLKNLYWEELFDNMGSITDKLTKKSREQLLSTLTKYTTVDFSTENAYAVIIWALKNANVYFDKQLLDVYYEMTEKENIVKYKSNKRLIDDEWRYCRRDMKNYALDYRLIFQRFRTFNPDRYGDYEYPNNLRQSTHDFINDIITIGQNLGFYIADNSYSFEWEPGKTCSFKCKDGSIFMDIKAYKNGNIHCKPSKKFIQKLNVEAGRLNNWIKSPKEAYDEMDVSINDVTQYYSSNLKLEKSNVLLLENNQ